MTVASARHILVESEALCLELKSEIEQGADFAELAKKHSSCPSGQDGGELGEFGPGMMVPEFDKVVFSAPVLDQTYIKIASKRRPKINDIQSHLAKS